ncbi:MAG: hypothetical protein R2750_03905 [Bacteroidales bacterium]
MKKLTLIAAITFNCLLITFNLFSQPCLPEGIVFETQAQIDSFQFNFPYCTEIEGDVTISGGWSGANINNLDSLYAITSIGGRLTISQNPVLLNLNGLSNLTTIGDDLWIYNNDGLTNFSGLENLTMINGDLEIIGHESLISLSGLENINSSSINSILIRNNPSLSNCQIQSICDYLSTLNTSIDIYANAEGCNNPSEIASACGFEMPCLPYGNYYFMSQYEIDNFQTDYPYCINLNGNVNIDGSDITNLQGLNTIHTIESGLWINLCDSLTNLQGLNNLHDIGDNLELSLNQSLTSLSGLESLTSIGGSLTIYDNMLTSIESLENLSSIGGWLQIVYNDSLTNLAGLDNVDPNSLNQLIITNNFSLSNCEAQSICEYLVNQTEHYLLIVTHRAAIVRRK